MASTEKRRLTAEDLYDIQIISNPRLSPDGRHVVYVQQRVDRKTEKKYSNLWVVTTDTQAASRQFTYGDQADRQPIWSPDGSRIAFLSNRRDEKQPQLFVIPFQGGEARSITDLKGEFGNVEWSPDGQKIAFAFRKKDQDAIDREADETKKKLGVVARHFTRISTKLDGYGFLPKERWQIWTVEIKGGETRQLTDSADFDSDDLAWSPDGRSIVFASNHSSDPDLLWDQIDLYLINVESGQTRQLDLPAGPKSSPRFSPDGRWLAYYRSAERSQMWQLTDLWVAPLDGSEPARNLTEDFDVQLNHQTINDISGQGDGPPTWSPDSGTLFFQSSQHGSTVLTSISVDESKWEEVIGSGGAIGMFTFDQSGTKLAYFKDTLTDPGQIWFQNMETGETRQLTYFNRDWLASLDLGEVEEVWYKGQDGNDLQGWILKPPGFDPNQKYPAILEIHGGPLLQYGFAFMHEFYFLAAHNYVVFFTNPRGGQGYGAAHAKAIYNDWGRADYADVMAWTDYVEKLAYIDETRLGVTGGSYGGFMTNWVISHTDRFKAAVTQRSVSNFISMLGSSDLHDIWRNLFGAQGYPWNDFENYWRQSPLKYFGNIKTPTLVIHSEQDLRCDIEQGEQVFVALKLLGVDTEMVRFPEESHGLSRGGRTDRRIVRLNHILRWFDKYLKS